MLVALDGGQIAGAALQEEIRQTLAGLEVRVRFESISRERYHNWVQQQGKPRHIVTLLSRQVTAEQIAQLTAVTVKHGLNIDHINRLSGRVPLESLDTHSNACVEYSVRIMPHDTRQLRADFMELSTRLEEIGRASCRERVEGGVCAG